MASTTPRTPMWALFNAENRTIESKNFWAPEWDVHCCRRPPWWTYSFIRCIYHTHLGRLSDYIPNSLNIYIYSYYKGFCWGGLKHSNKPDCCWWIPLNTVCVWQIIQDNHHSDFWRTSPAVLEHMTFPCSLTPLSITLSRKSVFPHVGLENIQWFVAPSRFTTGGNSILGSLNNVIFHRIPVINGEHP